MDSYGKVTPITSRSEDRQTYPDMGSKGIARWAADSLRTSPRLSPGIPRPELKAHLERKAAAALSHSFYLWDTATALESLMHRALRLRETTAWVTSDDFEAVNAYTFLRRRGIAVPGRISLVGFNNSIDALRLNISSCDRNIEGLINAMYNYVVNPHLLGSALRKKVISLAGHVVARGSSGPKLSGFGTS